jgi:hypothetical protein
MVNCIFLNKMTAVRAMPFLQAFFEQYSTPNVLRDADPVFIREEYFRTLGLFCWAWWLIRLAAQFLDDPPIPHGTRSKSHNHTGPVSEVAHLVVEYASDA